MKKPPGLFVLRVVYFFTLQDFHIPEETEF